jgi:hypothetical protein
MLSTKIFLISPEWWYEYGMYRAHSWFQRSRVLRSVPWVWIPLKAWICVSVFLCCTLLTTGRFRIQGAQHKDSCHFVSSTVSTGPRSPHLCHDPQVSAEHLLHCSSHDAVLTAQLISQVSNNLTYVHVFRYPSETITVMVLRIGHIH